MSVKKFLCSKVEYAHTFEIASLTVDDIILNDGYSIHSIKTLSAELKQELKVSDPGSYCQQALTFTSNDTQEDQDLVNLETVFKLSIEDGSIVILGSLENPVRFTSGTRELEGVRYTFGRVTHEEIL